ncbi:hypothetical protein BJ912DRAFT_1025654 [Pholiota molesta]|nr:hypothetical protein BJ912DRAFT_1025654 [Pholiota molesta]
MTITPPQAPPTWEHSAEDITNLTKQSIDEYRKVMDKIGALEPKDSTFESLALQIADTRFDAVTEPLAFYQNVSPSKELRDSSNEAESLVRDFGVECSMRLDVFSSKVAAEKNIKESGQWDKLSPEEQRLVEKMLTTLKKELSQVCLEFSKNFNEENGFISFTEEELKGVPKDVISGYTKRTEGDKELYDVTYKTPDIFPIFKFAENPETRKRALEGHESRLEVNVPLLAKALEIRRKIASLLGYKTWADYITEVKMIKSGKGVEDESLNLDDMLVKEYFPVSVVVPTILTIYQNLLSVQFHEIKKPSTWHPEVQAFEVWEKDAKDESDFVGYCYLDLFPRANKYSHAAVWPILPGYDRPDGKRSYPLTAMVANLAKPTPDKPALMRHDDVVTFFHEMGHVFHGLLSKTKFARFHGTSVARDFVEAPSQMLENWCWEPKVLEQMSSHYETQQPLSPELIEKIIKSRYVNVGLFYLRQLFFAKFDLKVHTDQVGEDYTQLWNDLREKISLVKYDKPCPGQASFGHITGGYDAGYYGYLHVFLVFAADMYATVFKADPLDPARGKLYRDKILRAGGSREELDTLKDFLGRPPNSEAFLQELFGTVPASKAANL